ncbi:MAG: bifunctional diguanylate cyclase/phosphodiesterase, partial [Micromonosporaceae bacterium]|nr:bifunctional diguanylate cyclase/phosphodiesterase [Micromonosporaceae bacterium]
MSAGRHAVRPRYSLERWSVAATVGSLVALLTMVMTPAWLWVPGTVQAAGLGAAAIGVIIHRPPRAFAWWIMLVGAGGWTIASAVIRSRLMVDVAPPQWSTIGLTLSYATVAAGLALLSRRPGGRTADLVDMCIIGVSLAVIAWALVVRPLGSESWPLPSSTAVALGHAASAAILVGAVLRFAAMENRPSTASGLLTVAVLALALADVAIAAPAAGTAGLSWAGDLASRIWGVALGAAALHPACVQIQTIPHGPVPAASTRRFAVFIALAIVAPLGPSVVAVMAGRGERSASLADWVPPAAAAAVICCLMVIRLGLITRGVDAQARSARRSLHQRAALERELRHRATHDPLTGLANRAVLLDRLNQTIDLAGTLIIVDLDGFKDVNDTLGHAAGDEVLLQVARRLRLAADPDDLVVRLGSDEFALLCREGTDGKARARRALDALRPGFSAGAGEVYLSGTAGLLELGESTTSADALRDADLALTAAKEIGKNQIVAFHSSLREERVRKGELAAGLRKALFDGRLSVHYQPVVSLADGRMAAVEALIRWFGDDGIMIPPMQFIPVAEETGLIVPVGKFVLRRACFDARVWHERYGIAVTVNVSGQQLREPDFVEDVLAALAETELPPKALVLELTESTMITEIESTRALERLRDVGVRIAIDDFGTGYSSLSYLVRLPVDILKIDRAFTSPPAQPAPHHWAFVRAILDLASSLRLQTIAEGIETDQQAHTLRNLACPLAQGFLYSRAVPAPAIAELLSAWNTRYEEEPVCRREAQPP